MNLLFAFLLLFLETEGYMQLVDPIYPQSFSSGDSPLTFSAMSEEMRRSSYSSSYSLVMWVKFEIQPATSQVFVSIKKGTIVLLKLSKLSDGRFEATATTVCGGTITAIKPGFTTPLWHLIAVIACSSVPPYTFSLSVGSWVGATSSITLSSANAFIEFDPPLSELLLGGTAGSMMTVFFTQGQIVTMQFDTSCRSIADVTSLFAATQCFASCNGACSGPSVKDCDNFLQLTDAFTPTPVIQIDFLQWGTSDPPLVGNTFSSTGFSFSGWYYKIDASLSPRSLFRAQTVSGDTGQSGNNVMALMLIKNSIISVITDDLTGPDLSFPDIFLSSVIFMQPITNKWIFVGISVCSGTVQACVGFFGDSILSCNSNTPAGGTITFVDGPDSKLFVGDPYIPGIEGQVLDLRYYLNSCLIDTDYSHINDAKIQNCVSGCSVCLSPVECSSCSSGYYLSAGICKACSSCCVTCTGPGNVGCVCESACYLIASNSCISNTYTGCHPNCATCSGPKAWDCLTCKAGLSLHPQNTNLCVSDCPSGYTTSSQVCVGSNQIILDYILDSITSTCSGAMTQTALNGATVAYFPPAFEASDPIPSKNRGYFFYGGQYIQLPPASNTIGNPTVIPASFTFSTWIRPQGTGVRTIYSKKQGCIDIFTVIVNSNNQIELAGGAPFTIYFHSKLLALDTWVFVLITFSFNSTTGITVVTFYYDGVQHVSTLAGQFYLKDSSITTSQTIGASSSLTDFFYGFIWRVKIHNYVLTTLVDDFSSPLCAPGSYYLSTAAFLQDPLGNNCLPSCTNGCVRPTDCSLCADTKCDVCPGFLSVPCTTCIANAVYTTQCDCNPGYIFNSGTRSCSNCRPHCLGCTGLICASCDLSYYLLDGECTQICPSGYSSTEGQCNLVNSVVLQYTFDKITPTVSGLGGSTAINGDTMSYFPPGFESSDPIPSKHRGYYFSGSQYVQLPPAAGTAGDPFILAPTFTISTWIRPQGIGTILSKRDISSVILQVHVISGNRIEIVGGNPVTIYTDAAILILDVWVFVVITCQYNPATRERTLTFYYDGIQQGTPHVDICMMLDLYSTVTQRIGATEPLSDWYSGFIWSIKISNFVSPDWITDFATPMCPPTLPFCLSLCPFGQTPECQSCMSSCSNGCVRSTDCSLCSDELCEVCTDFETLSCVTCASIAVRGLFCSCPFGSYLNRETRSCDVCYSECGGCSDYKVCTSCYSPAELVGSSCNCPSDFYPDPDVRSCKPCDSLCLTCISASICTSCKSNAQFVGSTCKCAEGYMQSSNMCTPCLYGCAECSESACIRCSSGYFFVGGLCNLHCPSGYKEDSTLLICTSNPGAFNDLTASLEVVPPNYLLVAFSSLLSNELLRSDITVEIFNTDGQSMISSFVLETVIQNLEYNITASIAESTSEMKLEIAIFFNNTSAIVDRNGATLITKQLFGVMNTTTTARANVPGAPLLSNLVVAVTQASVVGALINSLFSGSPGMLFTLLNNAQLLAYLPLSEIPMSQNVRELLASLNMASFIPNPFLFWLSEDSGETPPHFAANYGYTSCVFLVNIGVMTSVGAAMLVVTLVVELLSRCPISIIALLFVKMRPENVGSTFVRYWIQIYLDACLASFLQLRSVSCTQISINSFTLVFNYLLGVITAVIAVATPFLCLYFTAKTASAKKSDQSSSFQTLFEEFKNDKGVQSSLFYTVFLFQRLAYAFTLVFFNTAPSYQSLLCITPSLVVNPTQALIYTLYYFPYRRKLELVTTVSTQVCISAVFVLTSAFNYELSDQMTGIFDIGCYVAVYSSILISNATGLFSSIMALAKVWKAYKWSRTLVLDREKIISLRSQSLIKNKRR